MSVSAQPGPPGQSGVQTRAAWYAGVTRYQWLVLAIASAGWVFDAFEGQIFNITRNQLLADILKGGGTDADQELRGPLSGGVPGRRHGRRAAVRLAGGPMGTAATDGGDHPDVLGLLGSHLLRAIALAGGGGALSGGDGSRRGMGGGGQPGGGGVSQRGARACLGDISCDERAGRMGGGDGRPGGGRALALRLSDLRRAGRAGVLGHGQRQGAGKLAAGREPGGALRPGRRWDGSAICWAIRAGGAARCWACCWPRWGWAPSGA